MPTQYEKSKRLYRINGEYVSRLELRGLIDRLSTSVANEAARIARRYDSQAITAADFNLQMRTLLKSAHITASSIGRGGLDAMTAKDWGRVGRKIQWQYGYLDKFTRKLEQGTLKAANTASRAKSYVSSVYVSYADSLLETQKEGEPVTPDGKEVLVRLVTNSEEGCEECAADEAAGWMRVEDMGEIGSRLCGDWCKCDLEFSDEV